MIDQIRAAVLDQTRDKSVHGLTSKKRDFTDAVGMGMFYCKYCDKHHQSQIALDAHLKGKPHKRSMKLLKEDPFTQAEADAAIGLRTDNGKSTKTDTKMETS